MKKFLSFSLIITAFIVVLGSMLIFDVVDFGMGQVHLIGMEDINKVDETEIHNKVVKEIHEIGINFNEVSTLISNLNLESDPEPLMHAAFKLEESRSNLEDLINNNILTGKKADIKSAFQETYLPVLSECLDTLNNAIGSLSSEDLTEEALNEFKSHLETEHKDFVDSHNAFTNTLNTSR